MKESSLLVVTPEPFPYESLRGFLLRVSESNGYTSPSSIAKLLGVQESVLKSKKFPVRELSKILGGNPNQLDRYSYITLDSESTSSFKVLEHELFTNYGQYQIRSGAQFCPICAQEDGYIDAFWDLAIALACPRHKVKPLSKCHKCLRKINWFRPGLTSCDCGADYSRAPLDAAEPLQIELMEIICAKLHEKSILEISNQYQFPLIHFEKLPFGQLLSMFYKFGKMNNFYNFEDTFESDAEETSLYAQKVVNAGSSVFSRWPNNYIDFLNKYLNDIDKFGRKFEEASQIKKLINELTDNNYFTNKSDFLLNELLLSSSAGLPIPKPSPLKRRSVSNSLAYLAYFKGFEESWDEEQYGHEGEKPISLEDAAKFLGLPINVLVLFWTSGVMTGYLISQESKLLKFPWYKTVIEEILQTIKLRNLQGFRRSSVRNERLITLEEVMLKKNIRDEVKVSILNDILKMKISVKGRIGKKLSGLILIKKEIKEYVSKHNQICESDSLTTAQTSEYLCADEKEIDFLMRLGYLHYTGSEQEKRFPIQYLQQLESRLISLKKIAKIYNQSLERILEVISELGLRTIKLPVIKEEMSPQYLPGYYEVKIKEYFNGINP